MATTTDKVSYQPHQPGDFDTDNPEVIRAKIEATRADMSRTVDTIQSRLSPERLTHDAKETIKDATLGKVEDMAHNATRTAKGWRRNLVNTIKDNPIPATIAGIGLTWLFMSGSDEQENSYQYYDKSGTHVYGYPHYTRYPNPDQGGLTSTVRDAQHQAGKLADQVKDQAGNIAEQVSSQAQDVANQVSNQAQELSEQAKAQMDYYSARAQYQTRRAKRGFNQMLDENPLALGAMALAVGAAIGLTMPSTRKEDEWMGETRDRLIDQVQTQAKDTMQKVQNIAAEVADDVEQSAQEVVASTKEAAKSAKQTLEKEADKQGITS